MRTFIFLIALLLAAPPLAAKCADQFFMFSGSVMDQQGAPAAAVLVGVSWAEQSGVAGPAMSLTDAQGRYSIPVSFNTYSGHSVLEGDECNGALGRASISAYSSTHRSRFLTVDVGAQSEIAVPPLQLNASIQREPLWPRKVGG